MASKARAGREACWLKGWVAVPEEPTETEWLWADVDFLAAIQGAAL